MVNVAAKSRDLQSAEGWFRAAQETWCDVCSWRLEVRVAWVGRLVGQLECFHGKFQSTQVGAALSGCQRGLLLSISMSSTVSSALNLMFASAANSSDNWECYTMPVSFPK